MYCNCSYEVSQWHALVVELSTASTTLWSCNDAFKVNSEHKVFSETANICKNLAVRIRTCNIIRKKISLTLSNNRSS